MAQFRRSLPPLSGLTNMNRVYAIQRVNSAYSGNIINLRRSSDSVTADFTIDTTNSFLVTASGGQTVSAWLGAATATVVTWYDQSGNGRNLTQATTGIQPGFSTTTGVQLRSGKYMTFPDLVSITDVTFCVGYVQNAYLQGNSGLPWYLQDGIISNELPAVNNDWGLVVPGSGIFGLFTGGSSANSVINTNGLGTYAFMTATRSSSTGTITLYNGTGTGTVFTTTDTGSKSGQNPSYLGYNPAGGASYPANTNSDIASLFMFDDVKSTQFISTLATTFPTQIKPNLNYINPIRFYITNLNGSFSQLSASAKNSVTGVFGLKALFSSPARVLNLRRSTDSVTADFYADIQGNLTTSSGQTFASWIGAATAYVTTWYDQSSAARHATQVTTANQPTFDGTTVNFTTAANQYLSTPASCFTDLSSFTVTCRHTTVGNSVDQGIWGIGNSFSFGTNNLIRPGGSAGYRNYFLGLDFNVGTYAVGNIVTLKYAQSTGTGVSPSNGTRTLYVNQTSAGTNATTGWTGNGPGGGFLGHGSFAGAMDGGLYYIFMFNTALSDADRSIVENQTVAPIAPSIPINFFN